MLNVKKQIADGRLVCPVTRQRLVIEDNRLRSLDGRFVYPLIQGVPILVNPDRQTEYLSQLNGWMQREYSGHNNPGKPKSGFARFTSLGGDHRNPLANEAFQETVGTQPLEALCLSVGGGPTRVHSNLVNLNIDLFPNVDVVGDVYALPYADNAVDAIYCEAVIEHLEFPDKAVREMHRTLKPGSRLFSATPFLQWFHGFPNHYQNFTLIGHQQLFLRAGFNLVSSGVCVGPVFALTELITSGCDFLPYRWLRSGVKGGLRLFSAAIRPLDRRIMARNPNAHFLASTTYVQAAKE
ncbi:MAG: methyltransferase domain-containing protein [Verrucomicrobia bacterium]|nr:methyltransferase domain-containing protein [Verrucomicrobiota bacterium]MCG2681826.1 class I SAM-dependent methyltransferase [Kiritimatiellia bacterium]MBU4247708.1 methyltransferase domain-containing protein [Verrucomicrobiota bacterium]MBU4291641.1 methyltransferase domain-containing protein [Verrucomicrobiota bacterium]MBU4429542.1 methyltransferase domain-containing protein [Verrucomicrobiota bacterium]